MHNIRKSVFDRLHFSLRVLYDRCFPMPDSCPVCLQRQQGFQVCDNCRQIALKRRSNYGQCQRCHSFGVYSDWCHNCHQWPDYLIENIAIWPYEGHWQQLILDYKFRNKPWLAETLAEELRPFVPKNYDLLVPVPLHPHRLQERGYNQSELLAKELSYKTGIPCATVLERTRDTPHQTGLNRTERLQNLEDAFSVRTGYSVEGKKIILIDDVFTTGTTILQCARTLHRQGAACIVGMTLASGSSRW